MVSERGRLGFKFKSPFGHLPPTWPIFLDFLYCSLKERSSYPVSRVSRGFTEPVRQCLACNGTQQTLLPVQKATECSVLCLDPPCLTSLNLTSGSTKRHRNPLSNITPIPFLRHPTPVSVEYLFSKLDHLPIAQTSPLRKPSIGSDTMEYKSNLVFNYRMKYVFCAGGNLQIDVIPVGSALVSRSRPIQVLKCFQAFRL